MADWVKESEIGVIDWKLTGKCGLRCLPCYGPSKREDALDMDSLMKIIDKFSELSPSWVVLTGGEPLQVQDIESVMSRLNQRGIKIALSTNTLYYKQYQTAIEKYVSSLNIPIDGSTPKIHARLRKDEKSYCTFFEVLEHYQENPEKKPEFLRVGTMYSQLNRGDLRKIARKLEDYPDIIDTWKIYEIMSYYNNQTLGEDFIAGRADFCNETEALLKETPLSKKIMLSYSSNRDKAFFMINPQGNLVVPTEIGEIVYEVSVGNILIDSLAELVERWSRLVNMRNYRVNHSYYQNCSKSIEARTVAGEQVNF